MLMPWLRLFRVVNLPTVPGDVLVGAAAALWWIGCRTVLPAEAWLSIGFAAVSSCCLYLYGLADNDIVGAATDKGRPIPDGEISLRAASIARAVCLVLGVLPLVVVQFLLHGGLSAAAVLRVASVLLVVLALIVAIVAYNRTKRPLLMGLCRGLNVLLGVAAVVPPVLWPRLSVEAPLQACSAAFVAAVWVAYIAAVTKYSEGEEADPERRARVGLLIEGVVHLQMLALVVFTLVWPSHGTRVPLIAGAVLLVLLRTSKKAFRKVSAS